MGSELLEPPRDDGLVAGYIPEEKAALILKNPRKPLQGTFPIGSPSSTAS